MMTEKRIIRRWPAALFHVTSCQDKVINYEVTLLGTLLAKVNPLLGMSRHVKIKNLQSRAIFHLFGTVCQQVELEKALFS